MIHDTLPVIEFTAQDRCDRCGAQAYSLARRDDVKSDLLFCAHHRKDNYEKLLDEGWEIVDDFEGLEALGYDYTTV